MSRISLDTYRARYEALGLVDHKRRLAQALHICQVALDRGDYAAGLYWAAEAHGQAMRLLDAENTVTGTRKGGRRP
jgi:hypothetical protein